MKKEPCRGCKKETGRHYDMAENTVKCAECGHTEPCPAPPLECFKLDFAWQKEE